MLTDLLVKWKGIYNVGIVRMMFLGAVHHWDEWGLANILEEPPAIRKIHGEMIAFVKAWLEDWKAPVRGPL